MNISAGAHLRRTTAALGQAKADGGPEEAIGEEAPREEGHRNSRGREAPDAGSGQESRSAEACEGRFQESGNTIADNA